MLLRHLKVFGIAAVFAAIAYGLAHLLFRLVQSW
jgi:preprotein translocase subunit SecE